jgi:phage baseplate assembly protein W
MSGSPTRSMLGRSLSFPLRVGAEGRLAWSEGGQNIRESIAVILTTEQSERVALPDFGAGLGRFLFEPNTPATHALIEDAITRALARWEPRIAMEAVEVAADPVQSGAALATVTYRLVATGGRESTTVAIPTGPG